MINKNSTLKEFKELGLEEVQKAFEAHIGALVLFGTLEKAYEWWLDFNKKFYVIDNEAPEGFTSMSSAYVFYLTKLEGKQRNKMLGITDDLYDDANKANKWYKNISKYVHPDICEGNDSSGLAFKELKKLYDVMVEKDPETAEDTDNE